MRWIFRGISLVALVLALAVGALFVLPTERIAALVAQQFEAATGRNLTITGDVRPTLWPTLGITTGAVTLANADWSDAGPMLEAKSLSVGVETAALWGGAIRVKQVEAIAPVIRLERNADGQGNWELASADGAAAASSVSSTGQARAFSLEQAILSDGRLTFVDRATGAEISLTEIAGTARLDAYDGPAAIDLSARMNGEEIAFKGEVGALATLLTTGATTASASGKIGGSSFAFNGDAGLAPTAAGGAINLDLSDQDALFGLLGAVAPDLPEGLGQRIKIDGKITYTETGVTLRNAEIQLDNNQLNGDVDVQLTGERPKITARLSTGMFDMSSLAPQGGGESTAASGSGWSTTPIDVSALQSVDADIALSAQGLDLGLLTFGATQLRTTLDAGRAVTEIQELSAYQGRLTGSLVVNSRGGLSTRASVTASDVAIQPLLKDLAGLDRLIATGDVSVNLLGVGNSMDALMRSLEGDVSMAFGKGELLGLDLLGMLRNLDVSYVGKGQRTIFDGLAGSFSVANGVASNNDLRMDAQLLTASGQGTIDLGGQSMNYRLRPTLLEGQENGGLSVPLKITGPWAALTYQLDLEALAKEQLADEVEAVKAQAEQVILNKIEDETGISADSLGDVEGAVKNKVEEVIENEVGNALRGLLGR